ncbi:MAG: hypothetical protein Sv326_1018 [Candidatus Fermentimicrarchaeum limneticum]|uniref:Uncharacterized protein n=1 Tax=Fermentimicrarchaeum limneticum TaxID=2795018 RepID=A0A7D5XFI9_FERL1|nr:MAG: hypothetical protein Sv326_1018 [Candidatus Fermentimicrarchaeum limneticum]
MVHVTKKEEKPTIPGILKESDLLDRTMAPRDGEGKLFMSFKKEIVENLHTNAGCMAFAKKMCDDSDFYKLLEGALLERERRGYKYQADNEVYGFMETEIFNLRSVLSEISGKRPFRYDNLPARMPHSKLGYADLKRLAESDYEVKQEASALNTLLEKHREEFGRRIVLLTLHDGMLDHRATQFVSDLLRTLQEKHLYEGKFKFADIGTGSGEFSDEFVSFIRERFSSYSIMRTNPIELEIAHQKDLEVRIHDISKEPLGDKFNVVIIKDVMKFFKEGEPRGAIWENVKNSTEEGGVVLSGGKGVFNVHVMCHGELKKVAADAFLRKLDKIRGHERYLENLDDIVRRSDYDLITARWTGDG